MAGRATNNMKKNNEMESELVRDRKKVKGKAKSKTHE